MVAAYPIPVVGIILGVMARKHIALSGERGAGLALAAIIVGIAFTIAGIVILVIFGVYLASLANICGGSSEGCG